MTFLRYLMKQRFILRCKYISYRFYFCIFFSEWIWKYVRLHRHFYFTSIDHWETTCNVSLLLELEND